MFFLNHYELLWSSRPYIIIKLCILGDQLQVHCLVQEKINIFSFGCENTLEIQIQIWNLQNNSGRFGEWVEFGEFVRKYFRFDETDNRRKLVSSKLVGNGRFIPNFCQVLSSIKSVQIWYFIITKCLLTIGNDKKRLM